MTTPVLPEERTIWHWIIPSLWGGTIAAIVLYSTWTTLFGGEPASNCKYTSRQMQTIRKLDGSVNSVETSTVYGCEYPNGTFEPDPR